MVINAIIDRIDNGTAYLLSNEIGIEISIPADTISERCTEGEILSIIIDSNNNVSINE